MERLPPCDRHLLESNYRSHPSIVTCFSNAFYGKKVIPERLSEDLPAIKAIPWPRQGKQRVIFVHYQSLEQRFEGGYSNRVQVETVYQILQEVLWEEKPSSKDN